MNSPATARHSSPLSAPHRVRSAAPEFRCDRPCAALLQQVRKHLGVPCLDGLFRSRNHLQSFAPQCTSFAVGHNTVSSSPTSSINRRAHRGGRQKRRRKVQESREKPLARTGYFLSHPHVRRSLPHAATSEHRVVVFRRVGDRLNNIPMLYELTVLHTEEVDANVAVFAD